MMSRSALPRNAFLWGLSLFLPACGSGDGGPPTVPSASPTPLGGPVVQNGTRIAQDAPAELTLSYVERLPHLDYVAGSADPATDGWPATGSTVIWRAHVKNWSDQTLDDVDYAWTLDGAQVAGGQLRLRARSEATTDFSWTWDRRRHELRFTIDSSHRHTVPGGSRNGVLVYTDALGIGLYVESDVYDTFRRFQHELGIGNSSFEDWAHLQIELYNLIFARAVYPETPQGVLDRVRLDAVHIVPNDALPLDKAAFTTGGTFNPAYARPDIGDRSVDMQWGFPSRELADGTFDDHTSLDTRNQFYYSGFIQHEMGHARYLVDVYGWDVYDGTVGSRVDILEQGERVAGSRFMPGQTFNFNGIVGIKVHETPYQGLMATDWRYLDRYSAAALNLIAGRRALDGNYNEPANIGAFMNDLPRENRLTLRDTSGRPLGGARVQLFQAAPGDPRLGVYAKVFDGMPDLRLTADSQGQVLLGTNPFSSDGPIVMRAEFMNGTLIARVELDGKVGYGFLESADFNLEYWRGHRERGEHELRVRMF